MNNLIGGTLTGDGSFGFNGMEIDTMVRHNLPVKIIVGNNAENIKTKRPPDKKFSEVGNWSKKKNAIKSRIIIIEKLSFLSLLNVNPENINKLNAPRLAKLGNAWPKITLIVPENQEMHRKNKRILSKFIFLKGFLFKLIPKT